MCALFPLLCAGADPGGLGLGVVTPPPALDHQFFFSTNFLTIAKKQKKTKNRSEYSGNIRKSLAINNVKTEKSAYYHAVTRSKYTYCAHRCLCPTENCITEYSQTEFLQVKCIV